VQDAVLKVAGVRDNVRFVSFTVDPANDTPPVLAAYANTHGALPSLWYFLTGPVATLQMLDRDAFKLGNLDATMQHSTRFVLVDGQGRVRGYYDTSDSPSIPKLISDLTSLALKRT
jgi:protein SCO1/2